jgi:hypothetical protein
MHFYLVNGNISVGTYTFNAPLTLTGNKPIYYSTSTGDGYTVIKTDPVYVGDSHIDKLEEELKEPALWEQI